MIPGLGVKAIDPKPSIDLPDLHGRWRDLDLPESRPGARWSPAWRLLEVGYIRTGLDTSKDILIKSSRAFMEQGNKLWK